MDALSPIPGLTLRVKRRPYDLLKIAHRGFVTPAAPACSLAAFRMAIENGYDMVELDVRESQDGVPFVHHDWSLERSCGPRRKFGELASSDIAELRYLGTQEAVASLEEVLALCRGHVGIMLDVKDASGSDKFFTRMRSLLETHGFAGLAVTISSRYPKVARHLAGWAVFRLEIDEFVKLRTEGKALPENRFAFSHQRRLTDGLIRHLKEAGVPVIATIVPGRYPKSKRLQHGAREIARLQHAGIQGLLFDSMYHAAVFG